MKRKIIPIKNVDKIFSKKYFKLRREDLIKILANKHLLKEEKYRLGKLADSMGKGDTPNEFIVIKKKGKIILKPMED